MTRVTAFANQKGGVGKTTTCVNIAAYLASFGYSALLVDLDAQANASSSVGIVDKNLDKSIYSALSGVDVHSCIRHLACNVDIIPASIDLSNADRELDVLKDKHFVLDGIINQIKHEYDFVLIDCAPCINLTLINALCAADEVIVPLQCEYFALEGLNQLLNTIRLVKKHLKSDLELGGVVLTMFSPRTKICADVESNMRNLFGDKVYKTVIPRNVRLCEAPSYHKTILEYDSACKGAIAYNELTKEYISKQKE